MTITTFGKRQCPVCGNKKRTDDRKLTIEQVQKKINNIDNYELISKKYISSNSKLLIKHLECGNIFKMKFNNFQQGNRCPICFGTQKHTIEYIRNFVNGIEDYIFIGDEYINCMSNIQIKHLKCGNEFSMKFNNFQQGQRCPICANNGTSRPEQFIQKYVKSFYPDVICNDRTQILNPLTGRFLELDVYLPSLNKAIEFNGTYWHSNKKAQIKDKIKIEECKRLGIDLLIIKEKDFINNKEQELQKIRNHVNGSDR